MRRQTILLNGPSSSGKSTLARALKRLLCEEHGREFGVVSIDDLLEMSPDEPIYEDDVYAITGELCARARAALEACGGVIIDQVMTSERIYDGMMRALEGCHTMTVRVACAAEVLRRREALRGDRCLGSAEASERYLYPKTGYDVTVDTGELSPEACARRILRALE
ncbi:MAG: AAA family ATPase [Candidatus Spyradocola sp.]